MSDFKIKPPVSPEDVSELQAAIQETLAPNLISAAVGATENGAVRLQFPKAVLWMDMTPDQAEQLATGMVHFAKLARERKQNG